MTNKVRRLGQAGFTLIEILVALILLAVLAAAVFPVVTQQVDDGDPVRAANDLANIRLGIETFGLNVRPTFPGELEDLVHRVSSTDEDVDGSAFTSTQASKWNGPYIDVSLPNDDDDLDVITTGYGATIVEELNCFDAVNNTLHDTVGACVPSTDFVAVPITGLSDGQFEAINSLIDGENETTTHTEGKLRFIDNVTTDGVLEPTEVVYYLTVPFRG